MENLPIYDGPDLLSLACSFGDQLVTGQNGLDLATTACKEPDPVEFIPVHVRFYRL